MASNSQKLKGLINTQTTVKKGEGYAISVDTPSAEEPVAPALAPIQRGGGYSVSTSDAENAPLPEAVLALRDELQTIARQYIGARRRSGRALLEAARWLSEARAAADHGEWDDFLAATETTADTAERLRRIYDLAMQHPAFADAVADGRLNQSAAERLARGTTPVEVIDAVLTSERAPTVADVDRAIRSARRPAATGAGTEAEGQIPQIAEFGDSANLDPGSHRLPSPELLCSMISEHAAGLSDIALHATRVPTSGDVTRALETIERAVVMFRASIERR